MDEVRKTGVDIDLPRSSQEAALKENLGESALKLLREKLFAEAKERCLCDKKDELVMRQRRARGPTLKVKYAGDSTELIYLLKNRLPVPRTLLKNGK